MKDWSGSKKDLWEGRSPLTSTPLHFSDALHQPGELNVGGCCFIDLPKIHDERGNLTFLESGRHIPFEIKRVYFLYDIPGGAMRAGHSHKTLHQFLIAMSGSFDVLVDDGIQRRKFHLNRSYYGLYILPMVWREIDNFSSGSVCLALASDYFNEADYCREYQEFLKAIQG